MKALSLVALCAVAAPAAAQTPDPLMSHRLQMEQVRARTELQGVNAGLHSLQSTAARRQLQSSQSAAVPLTPPPPDYVPASSPRCDPRTVSPQKPCVIAPRPPARR